MHGLTKEDMENPGSLHFELRGYATYKGEISNSSKEKIPIKLVCDEMDILFSSNATRTLNLGPRYGRCHVDGIWFGDLAVLEFQHLKYLLLVLALGCIAVGKARQFGYRRC
ncbi:hypothetical protein PanWU01x14_153480 [Parasponia andersonii]|uniref:Uncharacterized protein n=1 Tax=Parasponia andersonii TaxID=3476 RepID=A0A2P5CH36_PARAD|nr:hypothetical protein PanWU01x14_153480 [Parasponia andersonii]